MQPLKSQLVFSIFRQLPNKMVPSRCYLIHYSAIISRVSLINFFFHFFRTLLKGGEIRGDARIKYRIRVRPTYLIPPPLLSKEQPYKFFIYKLREFRSRVRKQKLLTLAFSTSRKVFSNSKVSFIFRYYCSIFLKAFKFGVNF